MWGLSDLVSERIRGARKPLDRSHFFFDYRNDAICDIEELYFWATEISQSNFICLFLRYISGFAIGNPVASISRE